MVSVQAAVYEIIERHISACGGRTTLSALVSRTYEGAIKAQGLQGKITSVMKAPNKTYQLVRLGQYRQEVGFDGFTSWKKDNNGLSLLSGDELEQTRENATFNRLLRYDDRETFSDVKLVDRDEIEGRQTYAVEYTFKSGNTLTSYYDLETFLEAKIISHVTIKGTSLKKEVYYGDYRDVTGLVLPFKVKQVTSVNKAEITVAHYKLNAEIDDKVFEAPAR